MATSYNQGTAPVDKKKAVVEARAKTRPTIKSLFAGEDPKDIAKWVFAYRFLPEARRALVSIAHSFVDAFFYGVTGGAPKGGKYDVPSGGGFAYNKVSGEQRAATSGRPETIIFKTREDAERVLARLYDDIERDGHTTMGDLYAYAGLDSKGYTYRGIGWYDLEGTYISDTYDGYMLVLPRYKDIEY